MGIFALALDSVNIIAYSILGVAGLLIIWGIIATIRRGR